MGRKFTDYEMKTILGAHRTYKANIVEAVNGLYEDYGIDVAYATVQRIWKERNLPMSRGGFRDRENSRSLADEKEIINAYERYRGSPTLAARSMRHSRSRIRQVWTKAGLTKQKTLERRVTEN